MKETTLAPESPSFEQWYRRFDDILSHQAQKQELRNYLGGFRGETPRKKLSCIVAYALKMTYETLHHF